MKDYKKFKYLFFSTALLFFFASCGDLDGPNEQQISGEALGTTYNIIYFAEEGFEARPAIDSIIEVVNQSMSTYRPTSDISKINKGDATILVDEHFLNVFKFSKKVNEESSGYFDPTVGNLVNAYGFGAERAIKELDSALIDSLHQNVGLQKIKIDEKGLVKKENPQVYLEFNAVAKGYAVDLIADFLNSKNVENYLIELGGELVGRGKNLTKDEYWTVAIDDPQQSAEERTFQAVLKLKNRAMATSGNYRKYRIDERTGLKYVHTINPLTGYPEKSNVLSASILAENCALADAYATACMAMGLERAKQMISNLQNVDAYIIYAEDNGQEATFTTEGFKEVLVD